MAQIHVRGYAHRQDALHKMSATMMNGTLVQLIAFPGWVVGIDHTPLGYRCWVITPELTVLNDGEFYHTRQAARAVGCELVRQTLGL